MKWVLCKDRLPPLDEKEYLVVTDVRPDRPVIAHRASEGFMTNFPFSSGWLGRCREAILIGNHMRDAAKILLWLDTEGESLYPEIPKLTMRNLKCQKRID